MKISIQTLGCKVNQYESQAMEMMLTERGHDMVPQGSDAEVYIINSCTVTSSSDRKSRQAVRQAQRRKEGAIVALCGCFPQVSPEEAEKLEVDLLGGTGDRVAFVEELEKLFLERQKKVLVDNAMARREFEALPAGGLSARTRGMLKIEDGCQNFCSYCIIPYARGPVRSLPLADIQKEMERLAKASYREVVVTGIEISSWRGSLGETLIDALECICQLDPKIRIRLGSLEPRTITKEFCERASKLSNLCPHFHLSMQSGSDKTLKKMNRKYDTARYFESVSLLRDYFPKVAITTDFIVGFPGETEEDFKESLAFIETCQFSSMHIFPYSIREGTPAAKMPNQLTNEVKHERAKRGELLAKTMEKAYLESLVGETLTVLFEEEDDSGAWKGHTGQYVPVKLSSPENLQNRLRKVAITATQGLQLLGEDKGDAL